MSPPLYMHTRPSEVNASLGSSESSSRSHSVASEAFRASCSRCSCVTLSTLSSQSLSPSCTCISSSCAMSSGSRGMICPPSGSPSGCDPPPPARSPAAPWTCAPSSSSSDVSCSPPSSDVSCLPSGLPSGCDPPSRCHPPSGIPARPLPPSRTSSRKCAPPHSRVAIGWPPGSSSRGPRSDSPTERTRDASSSFRICPTPASMLPFSSAILCSVSIDIASTERTSTDASSQSDTRRSAPGAAGAAPPAPSDASSRRAMRPPSTSLVGTLVQATPRLVSSMSDDARQRPTPVSVFVDIV